MNQSPSVLERTAVLASLADRYVPRGLSTAHPIFAVRAQGSEMWDVEGRRYIDFAGGIGVLNVGHNHPRVMSAIRAQLERLTHAAAQVALYESYLRLAEQLAALVPGSQPKKALLLNTGAEAVENAVKIARAYTNRPAVITFDHSFHGRTLLALTLTGASGSYKQNFGPFAPAVHHAPYPYAYRGWTTERAIAGLGQLLEDEVAPRDVAAVIVEPVLGEGGFVPAPVEFLRELRRITREHGILLVVDEIQTGFGRTGRMFGLEHAAIEPDLVVMAKSLAGGLPLSAVVGDRDILDAPAPGGLGSTYGGNPVACAGALAVLAVIEEEGLVAKANDIASVLRARAGRWAWTYGHVGDVRILGAMAGIELIEPGSDRAPAAELVARVIRSCREQGLLLLKAGGLSNVIRLLMPLTTPAGILVEGVDILERGIAQATASVE
ncbi:MAG: 4-aminobutyrate--2-oxoglutarate transaminase [Chloroflexota bacterium]